MNENIQEVEAVEEEVEQVDEIREAFDTAVLEDKKEDDVKMALIGAGATFKNVTRLYTKYMVDAGFSISKEAKDEIVAKILEGKEVETEEDFGKVVAAICKKATGVSEKAAGTLVRAWAKAKEIPFYSKPKGEGGARDGFKSRFLEALVANPQMTEAGCTDYLKTAEGHSENIRKHESVYQGIRKAINKVYADATGDDGGGQVAKAA